MPIPTAVFNILGQLLNVAAYHLGERLGQTVANYASSQGQSSISPVPIEQVKSDPRYVQALVEYVQRKDIRDKE